MSNMPSTSGGLVSATITGPALTVVFIKASAQRNVINAMDHLATIVWHVCPGRNVWALVHVRARQVSGTGITVLRI